MSLPLGHRRRSLTSFACHQLSRLLEEAAELDPTQRATWVEQHTDLEPELASALRELLAKDRSYWRKLDPIRPRAAEAAYWYWYGRGLSAAADAKQGTALIVAALPSL